jgi:DNA-binding response OmpR family regulator
MEGAKKILIVDDEPVLADLLRAKLSQKGFNVIEAHDGEEGLNMALQEHPDFILLDVVMPKVDGLTMLKKLREDQWGSVVPVLILSNLNTTEAVKNSQSGGAFDYLVKIDYTLEELAEIVKKKLEELEKGKQIQ